MPIFSLCAREALASSICKCVKILNRELGEDYVVGRGRKGRFDGSPSLISLLSVLFVPSGRFEIAGGRDEASPSGSILCEFSKIFFFRRGFPKNVESWKNFGD